MRNTRKTIYCMRFVSDNNIFDLRSNLLFIRERHANPMGTAVTFKDGSVIRIQRCREDDSRVFVQLVRYVPGERAPTIISSPVSSEDVGDLASPPEGREYKDGDCYILCSNKYVIFCQNGISSDKAGVYLSNIISSVLGIGDVFRLVPVARIDRVTLLARHGVKSISFKMSAHRLSVDSAFDSGRKLGVFSGLASIFKKDDSLEERNSKLNDIMIGIDVSARGNRRASQPSKDALCALGLNLLKGDLEDTEDICIITHNNEKLSLDSIRMQTSVNIKMAEKSLDFESAFDKMMGYMNDLESEGLLDD